MKNPPFEVCAYLPAVSGGTSISDFLLLFFAPLRLCVKMLIGSRITPEFEGFLINADMGMWLDHFMDRLPKGEVNKGGALDREAYVRKQGHYLFLGDGAPR